MKNCSYKINIIIEKDADGYYAYCSELQNCHSQGYSFEEVNINIKETIELYLETLTSQDAKKYLSKESYTTSFYCAKQVLDAVGL